MSICQLSLNFSPDYLRSFMYLVMRPFIGLYLPLVSFFQRNGKGKGNIKLSQIKDRNSYNIAKMKLNMTPEDITREIFNTLFDNELLERMKEADKNNQNGFIELPDYFIKKYDLPSISDKIILPGENSNCSQEKEEDQTTVVLASYTFMNNSPGIITYYGGNIVQYVGGLLCQVIKYGFKLGVNTALYTTYFVIKDLMAHESFHHYCDVKRHLTGSVFDPVMEDCLAVAHSYNCFSTSNYILKLAMNYSCLYDSYMSLSESRSLKTLIQMKLSQLHDYLKNEHFNTYQTANYKNWHLYTHKKCYSTAFYNYIKNEEMDKLVGFGVPLNSVFEEIKLVGNAGCIIILRSGITK